MKRKVLKIGAMFMALILMISSETQYVFAKEREVKEDLAIGDIEINLTDNDIITVDKKLSVNELAVETDGDETVIYAPEEIQTLSMDDASTLYYGTVSGYLSQTGEYALYSVSLSAGDYLQARLTLPNNYEIDYDLVLYDSALAYIKASDYCTYLNETGTLEESIGYKATTDEQVYIGIFSILGGSDTEAYTLDFSITTNFSDNSEPNENANEAIALTLGTSGASVSNKLNSPIDNDWYVFTVLDSPAYDKIRLKITSNSTTNGCIFEIYTDQSSDEYYAMRLYAWGTGGEIDLPVGTYYLRVVSTNTFNDFNYGDIPTYNLSVTPVSRVDGVQITKFAGYNAAMVPYPEGTYWRIDEKDDEANYITIVGWAYYTDSFENKYRAANVEINAAIIDEQWEEYGLQDITTVYGSAVTGSDGFFSMRVLLNPALGGLTYPAPVSMHYYDKMRTTIVASNNSDAKDENFFYLLKYCIPR